MGFADETISVVGDWGFGGNPDMLGVTEDEGRGGSGCLDLGVLAYLWISCVLWPASKAVTDILPRRAVNEDTSTLQFPNGLPSLAGGVSLN